MLFLLLIWGVFVLCTTLLYAVPSISRCSGLWVFILLLTVSFMAGITFVYGRIMIKLTETKKRIGYEFAAGEVQWNPRNALVYPASCFVVGLAAAGLGVGGGMGA